MVPCESGSECLVTDIVICMHKFVFIHRLSVLACGGEPKRRGEERRGEQGVKGAKRWSHREGATASFESLSPLHQRFRMPSLPRLLPFPFAWFRASSASQNTLVPLANISASPAVFPDEPR
jgi:hypothetical protein